MSGDWQTQKASECPTFTSTYVQIQWPGCCVESQSLWRCAQVGKMNLLKKFPCIYIIFTQRRIVFEGRWSRGGGVDQSLADSFLDRDGLAVRIGIRRPDGFPVAGAIILKFNTAGLLQLALQPTGIVNSHAIMDGGTGTSSSIGLKFRKFLPVALILVRM